MTADRKSSCLCFHCGKQRTKLTTSQQLANTDELGCCRESCAYHQQILFCPNWNPLWNSLLSQNFSRKGIIFSWSKYRSLQKGWRLGPVCLLGKQKTEFSMAEKEYSGTVASTLHVLDNGFIPGLNLWAVSFQLQRPLLWRDETQEWLVPQGGFRQAVLPQEAVKEGHSVF